MSDVELVDFRNVGDSILPPYDLFFDQVSILLDILLFETKKELLLLCLYLIFQFEKSLLRKGFFQSRGNVDLERVRLDIHRNNSLLIEDPLFVQLTNGLLLGHNYFLPIGQIQFRSDLHHTLLLWL